MGFGVGSLGLRGGVLTLLHLREFFIDNLLVRIHLIIVMIRWTGLASWEFEFPFAGSLTSTFLVHLTFNLAELSSSASVGLTDYVQAAMLENIAVTFAVNLSPPNRRNQVGCARTGLGIQGTYSLSGHAGPAGVIAGVFSPCCIRPSTYLSCQALPQSGCPTILKILGNRAVTFGVNSSAVSPTW